MAVITKIREYLINPAHRRRVIFASVGLVGVVLAVLLVGNLTNLFNRPGSSHAAVSGLDANKIWQTLQAGGAVETPHAKMIVANQGGSTWLYVIGGIKTEINQEKGRSQAVVLNSVRRIKLNPETGDVIGGVWEGGDPDGDGPLSAPAWGTMNTGHMEFGLVQAGNDLFVVGGDMNVPTLTGSDADKYAALPYSTIERLSLTNPNSDWTTFALLGGVNYYPGVTVFKNNIQVVGGVLGNPFPPIDGSITPDEFASDLNNQVSGIPNFPIISGTTDPSDPAKHTLFIPRGNLGDTISVGSGNTTRLPALLPGVPQSGGTGTGTGTGSGGIGVTQGISAQGSHGVHIQSGDASQVKITYPNGNEVINAGDEVKIRWDVSDVHNEGSTSLSYSTDGGATWKSIAPVSFRSNNCDTGQVVSYSCYKWIAPNEPSKNVLVKIDGFANNPPTQFHDASDGYFEIKGTYLSDQLTTAIAGGKFVTTVGEYYKINPSNPTNPQVNNCSVAYACELGADFSGSLSNTWEVNKASHFGHVRFVVVNDSLVTHLDNPLGGGTDTYTPQTSIIPIPQGRYGHELFVANNTLYVLGGASWQKEVNITTSAHDLGSDVLASGRKTEDFKMFWVIDDASHPIYTTKHSDGKYGDQYTRPDFNFGFGRANYEFKGSVAYYLNDGSDNRWYGTNNDSSIVAKAGQLSKNFALKNTDLTTDQGRAFFALAQVNPNRFIATGGLINTTSQGVLHPTYDAILAGSNPGNPSYFRAPVAPLQMQTEKIDFTQVGSSKWDHEADTLADGTTIASPALYNLASAGLDGGAVIYTGQSSFQDPFTNFGDPTWKTKDSHVPDYSRDFSSKTALYVDPHQDEVAPRWYAMSDLNSDTGQIAISYVVIKPGASVIQPLGSTIYRAQAYDQNGNAISNDDVTYFWQTGDPSVATVNFTNEVGTVTATNQNGSTTTLTARATYNGTQVTGRSYISVSDSHPASFVRYVEINPGSVRVGLSEPRQFTAKAYDQYGQEVNSGVNFDWQAEPSAGTIDRLTGAFVATNNTDNVGNTFDNAIHVHVTSGNGNADGYANVTIKPLIQATPLAGFGADTVGSFTSGGNQLSMIYHYGGVGSSLLHTLGAFGTPADPRAQIIATVEVVPGTIPPDSLSFGLVKVKLTNGLGEPIFGNGQNKYGVRIETQRSVGPIASTDGSYRTGKVDRAQLLGNSKIPDTEVGYPEGFGEFVYLDDAANSDGLSGTGPGEANFRIYSKLATPVDGTQLTAFIETFGDSRASLPPAHTTLKVANIDGYPTAGNSTIVADPAQVAANDKAESTVTVTLKDWRNLPATGYFVRLLSDRNSDGVVVDHITPASGNEPLVDANGVVTFKIKSDQKGRANLSVSFGTVKLEVDDSADLPNTAIVQFVGMITSLSPDHAKQGQGPFDLTAVGEKTSWKASGSDLTTVAFIPPASKVSITAPAGYIYPANGFATPTFNIVAPDFARKSVTLSILPGGDGEIFGANPITLDSAGNGHFQYETGNTTGPVKIKAQVAGGPSETLLISLTDPSPIQPYFLEASADTPTIAPNGETVIRVGVYKHTASGKALQTTANVSLGLAADDGSFNPVSPTTTQGLAAFNYTSGTRIGVNHLFIQGTYSGFVLTDMVSVAVTDSSDGFTFDPTLTVTNDSPAAGQQTLGVSGVKLSDTAYLGVWTFRTMTPVGGGVIEVIDHDFTVLPDNRPKGPRIESLVPNIGFRGDTSKTVTINAAETHFESGNSKAFFTPVGQNGDATGITETATRVISPTKMEVDINIANTAYAGFWNVRVETDFGTAGKETAELLGNSDFLVTSNSDYIIDINPTPVRIPRDGTASSILNTFVGHIDRVTGQITPVPNATLTYSFVESDGGHFDHLTATTDTHGQAHVSYFTDRGTESQFVKIMANMTIDGVPVVGFSGVIKEVSYGNFLTLNGSRLDLPLIGQPDTSDLTADAVDRNGNPIEIGNNYIPVEFIIVDGSGQVIPISSELKTVAGRSQAISTYYRASGLTVPETATLIATANLPGIGVVFSNGLSINIGSNSSDYTTTITCDPVNCATAAGSSQPVTLTATLLRHGVAVPNWTVNFTLNQGGIGDYITNLGGLTDANGQIKTKFVPGVTPGFVTVVAQPVGLTSTLKTISKSFEDTIDLTQSTVSAVPSLAPADNIGYSVITVSLRNRFFVGLPGKQVSIVSSRATSDTISLTPDGSPASQSTTNSNGQAIFYVRSGSVGVSTLTASFSGMSKAATVSFETPGSLVAANFNLSVPLEIKQYDGAVQTYVLETGTTNPIVNEIYYKAFDGTDLLAGIPTLYFHPNKPHTAWAKDKYHLAKSASFTSPSLGAIQTVSVNIAELLIGDVTGVDGSGKILSAFHDNAITSTDFQPLNDAWGFDSYIANYWPDANVNSVDLLYWIRNFGLGTPRP